jgi:hypothetical protein
MTLQEQILQILDSTLHLKTVDYYEQEITKDSKKEVAEKIEKLLKADYSLVTKIDENTVSTMNAGESKKVNLKADDGSALHFSFGSWDSWCSHEDFDKFIGKRVKVSITIIPEEDNRPDWTS